MKSMFESDDGIMHQCVEAEIHHDVLLVWTLCLKDVPSEKRLDGRYYNYSPTCEKCLGILAELE